MKRRFLTKKFVWLIIFLLIFTSGNYFAVTTNAQNESLVYGDSDVPRILPRSTWDNTSALNSLMTWWPQSTEFPSDWQPVERIIVHDTGCDESNPTCNSNKDPIATIQGIYRYHAVTRGWGDIGYNYIIDQQGRIYEGRYGGNGSRGAHVYLDRAKDNFNYGTIGIAILGNYAKISPSQAALESLTRLTAWLCVANNLDPTGQRSSYIWNTLSRLFSTLFSGATIVGHREVEPGNPDPAKVDFEKLRRDAAVLAGKFKNYAYQVAGSDKIYLFQNGSRKTFNNLADFTAQGFNYGKVVNVSQSQMDLFSATRFLKYPDGSLLQINGQPAVYLIDNGQKRKFDVTAKQFTLLGFDFRNVKKSTADELVNYADGSVIKYGPDKALLTDGIKVFYIENGKKRWISSGNLLTTMGFKWSQVKNASANLSFYLDGETMAYPSGTLLRAKDTETVYLIENGQRRQFVSAQSFLTLGYKWGKVLVVDPMEVALCPVGDVMFYRDGTLVRAVNSPAIFLIEGGLARSFLSDEIFNNLKYKTSQILSVSAEELSYYSLGQSVGYKNGTLVRPDGRNSVYLISGGQAQHIDAATFKNKKYSWANVLVISARDFGILYEGQAGAPVIPSVSPSVVPVPSPTPVISVPPVPSVAPSPSPVVEAVSPKIRIAIFEVNSSAVTFTVNTPFDVMDKSGRVIAAKNADENFVYVIGDKESAFIKIVPQSVEGAVQIVSYEDHPAWKPSLNYNQFRGAVEVVYSPKSDKIWAVNELDLEDYLGGIAEISSTDAAEYQKAMVVAARTYAQYYIQKGGKRGADEVYILNNSSSDQLYKGYSREVLAPLIVEAVGATRGEIITYNGSPIVSAYSSGAAELQTSGTKSACSLWGSKYCEAEFVYLSGGVRDPVGAQYDWASCGGANHCVGLSGAGARAFAKAGTKNYQEILKHYYPGTEVKKAY